MHIGGDTTEVGKNFLPLKEIEKRCQWLMLNDNGQ